MISKVSIKRPITTVMIILIVFLAGVLAYNTLELAYMPSMDSPMAMISTTYSGAGPEEIEELITEPIEEALATMTGVESITSTSSVGSSRVMLEFVDGTDLDVVSMDLREKIDQIKGRLPDDANEPTIMKMDMNSDSINVGITSTEYDINGLYDLLEQNVTSQFERIDGVSAVEIMGGVESEIQITVDQEKMDGYGITISTIQQALSSENTNLPAGEILQGDSDLQLRAVGQFESINDISNLVINTSGGNVIHISDVAGVREVEKDQESMTLINGTEGIMYSLSKQSDANIVTVSDNIVAAIANIQQQYPELDIQLLTTTSDYIKTSINNVVETAFQSAIIAVFILLIFLRDPKASLVIGVSIPTSIMATFALMYLKGMTMNTISMGGIVIGIGMLVDNSVVVLENINTYWKKGYPPKEAAEKGTNEVAMAVFASTLTTIAVFFPLTFVDGMIGMMLQDIAYTICFALIASLVVSLTFVPMASSKLLASAEANLNKKKNIFSYISGVWALGLDKLDIGYRKLLGLALGHRLITVIAVIVCFIGSLSIIPGMGMDLMSSTDEASASVSVSMPDGTKYELVQDKLYQVMEVIGEIPEAETTFARVNGERASITYNLCDKEERVRSTDDVVDDIKAMVENIPGCEISVSASSMAMGSMGGGASLSLKITGDDTDTLKEISDDMIELLSEIPQAEEITSSMDDSIPEGRIIINRAKAAKYGVTTTSIANAVSTAISGSTATTYKVDGTEMDIRIKYPDEKIQYVSDLNNMTITTSTGAVIPLTEVAEISMSESAVSINREDQQRYITISGTFQNGVDTGTVQGLVQEKLDTYIFPDGYEYEFGGNMQMMTESFTSLGIVLLVAVLLVYMIMASQFESLLYPFIVMFSMPLAITGGILGLFVTGMSISVTAFMGFIMLVGMVVNNAIVLVDYTNQLREYQHMECMEALLAAGPSRLRPILMTTLTTVIGLLPMALATSSGMETQQPLGIAVIFGLSISTLVTLVFIPVLYSLATGLQVRIGSLWKRVFHRGENTTIDNGGAV